MEQLRGRGKTFNWILNQTRGRKGQERKVWKGKKGLIADTQRKRATEINSYLASFGK